MIDFQATFAAWLRKQIADNPIEAQQDIDELARQMYDTWLDTPQDEFDGSTPGDYFYSFAPKELVDELMEYVNNHVSIPDPLCDAINDCGKCAEFLLEMLNQPLTDAQNQAVLERLSEMQAEEMLDPCMRQIVEDNDTKADQAVQAVMLFGQLAAKLARDSYQEGGHSDKVTDRLADIVASCGPCEGGLEMLCELFEKREDARAFYAQCLAKTGDERALPVLIQTSDLPQLSYYDYTAIRDTVEELGGELEHEREFSGDKDYMTLQEKDE